MLWSTAEGKPKIVSAGWSEAEGAGKDGTHSEKEGEERGGRKRKTMAPAGFKEAEKRKVPTTSIPGEYPSVQSFKVWK